MSYPLHSPVGRFRFPWKASCVVSLGVASLAASPEAAQSGPVRLNVLFILTDDLRTNLGCYGDKEVFSPHIDALAARGIIFNRAYCQQPLSNPSRASFLTGLRPDTLKVRDLETRFREVAPDAVTLPQYFKAHGYYTRGIGKIFHNEAKTPKGRAPHKDPSSWSQPPTQADNVHWKDWVDPKFPEGPPKKQGATQCLDVPDNAYFDGRIADEAVAALAELKAKNQPFFLAVGFWKPHVPFNAPKKYWDLYDRNRLSAPSFATPPEHSPAIAHHNSPELRNYTDIPKAGPIPQDKVMEMRHGYLACVSYVDAQIGRVLDALQRDGLADNTIVVFLSDHGYHLGEQDLWCKTSNYELDARAPLIIAVPKSLTAGQRTQALVEFVDIFPTLTELAGLPPAKKQDGQSLVPILKDPNLPGKTVALTQHPQPFYNERWTAMGYSLRTDRFRYVEWRDRATGNLAAVELYDLSQDPMEKKNLAGTPAFAAAQKELSDLAAKTYHFTAQP